MVGSLAPVMDWAVRTTLCSALLGGRAVAIPDGDSPPVYSLPIGSALDGAAVEPFEDLRTHVKSFQSPEGYRFCRALFTIALAGLDHVSLLVMLS